MIHSYFRHNRTLNEIQAFIQVQLNTGRFKRFLKLAEFQDGLVEHNQKLDDCSRLFNVCMLCFFNASAVADIPFAS